MIGTRIRIRRAVLRLSQPELADALGVSVATISNWETGKTSPRADDLHRIAAALVCSAVWLLEGGTEAVSA